MGLLRLKSATLLLAGTALFSGACSKPFPGDNASNSGATGFELTFQVGSALGPLCTQAAQQFNATQPKLSSGEAFYLSCDEQGSGDLVQSIFNAAQQFQNGTLGADAPELPTLISLDGEVYHEQLRYRLNQIFPGETLVPPVADAPLLAFSPMVFMAAENLAPSVAKTPNLYQALVTAKTHQDLDPTAPPQPIHFVHTAPTRSNSGLQTLIAQFAAVSGKAPEALTIADVQTYQNEVQKIQNKITRYGVSTSSLGTAMVQNGPFWASIGSVYESLVIEANSTLPPGQPRYQAIYPPATYTSNMRGILFQAPWVTPAEREAAEQVLDFLQQPEIQTIATNLGLRPGVPGVALGPKFSAEFGVNPQATYDSYRSATPEVVEAMLTAWEEVAKRPSQVVVVVDSSGSMAEGNKLVSVQNTLQNYMNQLGKRDRIAFIDFDNLIRDPVLVDQSPEGQQRGFQFINTLQADGETYLYDAVLTARNWLQKNRDSQSINAVLVLTDGQDSGSSINLEQLAQELQKSGFSSDDRIAFFTIGYGQEGEFDPTALEQIANLNGGYYRKGDPMTIAQLMADLQLEF
ncbi:MAG: extracellular solute-binding protein [Prochlorothrix sp.]